MTHTDNHSEDLLESQEAFEQLVKGRLLQTARVTLIGILEEEVTSFIGTKPYERSEWRRDQRNVHYTRDLQTTVGLLKVLQPFHASFFLEGVLSKKMADTRLRDKLGQVSIGVSWQRSFL